MRSESRAAMRTSEAERERVADFLRDCCAEGRLRADELEQRLDCLFGGQTVADLELLVWDLPGGARVLPMAPPAVRTPTSVPARRARRVPRPAATVIVIVGAVAVISSMPPEAFVGLTAMAVIFGVMALVLATVLAPAGFMLVGLAWLAARLWRGVLGPRWR
jgi:hypothetical protein